MSAIIQQIPLDLGGGSVQQLTLDLGHRPAHGREDFLVANSNQDAVAWIDSWPEWPAPVLILYGPVASGKSHLASVWKEKCDGVFINTEDLCRKSADELANGEGREGRHLVLDHVDPWFGDRAAETTLFHLYNIMKEQKRTMLMTTRMTPFQVNFAIMDLASRLRAAPVASIKSPDDTLLSTVLVKLFKDRQIDIGHEVLSYAVPRMERSFSAAHDLVSKADELALSEKRPVSVPIVRRILLEHQ
jgi:chromosomal replication initiation ATPase DnaA